jgi:hypothetical protein
MVSSPIRATRKTVQVMAVLIACFIAAIIVVLTVELTVVHHHNESR